MVSIGLKNYCKIISLAFDLLYGICIQPVVNLVNVKVLQKIIIVIVGILLIHPGRIVATLLGQWGHRDMELYKLF